MMTDFESWQVITRDELEALYGRLTMTAIAARYGITFGAVSHRLRIWGLTKRQTGKGHSPGPRRSFNPPKLELQELYSRMSMREIAKHYGVGETVIFHRVKEAGLPFISRSDRLTGVPKSEAHKAALKASIGDRDGAANPNWRGGVTPESLRQRGRPEYRWWKETVLAQADYRCRRCNVGQGSRCDCCGHIIRLHAHHIRHFAKDETGRFDPTNGEALCEKCHHVEHSEKIG